MKILTATLLLITRLTLLHAQAPSAMFHNCQDTCGVYNGSDGAKTIDTIKWKLQTGGKIFSSPVFANGTIYIGSEDGFLYSIDATTGSTKWKFKTGGAIHSTPAVAAGKVFFGSFDGFYYAVDTASGKQKWRIKTGGEKWMGGHGYFGMQPSSQYMEDPWDYFLSSPVVENDGSSNYLYFGSSDHHLYKADAASGRIIWKYKTNGSIHTTAAVDRDRVYIGSWDAAMYAVDKNTGKLAWKFQTGQQPGMSGIQSSPVLSNGKIYFGARDAYVYCVEAVSGAMQWKYDAENAWVLSTPTLHDGLLYVGTSDSYLMLALDQKTGKEISRFKANGYVFTSPSIAGNTLYFGDFTGNLFALDLTSQGKSYHVFQTDGRQQNAQKVLKEDMLDFSYAANGSDMVLYKTNVDVMNKFYSLGSFVSTPAIHQNTLYIGSADGSVYALKLK